MTVAVDNLYIVKNGNGTVDTLQSSDPRMAKWVASACGYQDQPRGGVSDVVRISVLEEMHLDCTALKFNYQTSQN